jgi:hypothetical protein
MRTLRTFASLSLILAFLTIACRPPDAAARGADADVRVTVELPDDPVVGPAPLTIRLERDGDVVRGAEVEVTGDMTHAGMVPVVARAEERPDGSYRADGFAFDMAGDWIVTVEARLADGRRVLAEAATTVRRP